MNVAGPISIVLAVICTTPCWAGAQDVSPELRQRAIQICSSDAMRLCSEALMDEGQTVACMAGKRPQLTISCRVVYDQVARILRQ